MADRPPGVCYDYHPGIKKPINSELWHACAGPLVTLPKVGSLVYYFPQSHSEQVAVSTNRAATSQIPNYPNIPSQLLCQVHNATLHADKDTDEIYAQMSLQPIISEKDVIPVPDYGQKPCKHPTKFFCKTLTASDTSTHGGFSVPRRAAEKLFPQLELVEKGLMQYILSVYCNSEFIYYAASYIQFLIIVEDLRMSTLGNRMQCLALFVD